MTPLDKIKKTKEAVEEKIVTLILTALGLVAALAWNDAIQTLFKVLFPKNEGVIGKFAYAIIVTFTIVILTIQINKLLSKKKD